MSKFLILKFENAGLLKKGVGLNKTKDKILCPSSKGGYNRLDVEQFVEPIVVNQISNMLHVLFGERPKPMNRITPYDKIDYYYQKALDSYLKIENFKNDRGNYYDETISLNKMVFSSYNPTSYLNWNRIKQLLGDDLFNEFVTKFSGFLNLNVLDLTFYDFKQMVISSTNKRMAKYIEKIKDKSDSNIYKSKMPLYKLLTIEDNDTSINMNARTLLTIVGGPFKINRLNGEIIVPVTDDDLIKLRMNKGCATLLDGGIVYIKGVKHGNKISVTDHDKISNISLEKTL